MYSFETNSFRGEPTDALMEPSAGGEAPRRAQFAKRALDVALAGAGLVFFAPLLALACLAIWIETGGPVLFRQQRTGLGGRVFLILKLRTMTAAEDGATVQQATRQDARITRIGGLLRKFSIDELPQLWNVLKGDMSLVGPRPHAVAHDLHYGAHYGALLPQYAQRFAVRPGITGWAQVNGARGETRTTDCMARRVQLDLEYVAKASLALDLKILALTAVRVPFDLRAY
jgi:putative colanic acid biosysnthesis UDP-glucose lipid carrier transferase